MSLILRWSRRAMRPIHLNNRRTRAYRACSTCGLGLFSYFFLSPIITLFSLPVRYRLKYCHKELCLPPPPTHTYTHFRFPPLSKKKKTISMVYTCTSTSLRMSLLSYCHPFLPTHKFHSFDSKEYNFVKTVCGVAVLSILCTLPCDA